MACLPAYSTPRGTTRLEGPAAGIADFLELTYRLVPAGAEPARTDLDAVIAAILSEGIP